MSPAGLLETLGVSVWVDLCGLQGPEVFEPLTGWPWLQIKAVNLCYGKQPACKYLQYTEGHILRTYMH